jgi:hypothetical protein
MSSLGPVAARVRAVCGSLYVVIAEVYLLSFRRLARRTPAWTRLHLGTRASVDVMITGSQCDEDADRRKKEEENEKMLRSTLCLSSQLAAEDMPERDLSEKGTFQGIVEIIKPLFKHWLPYIAIRYFIMTTPRQSSSCGVR